MCSHPVPSNFAKTQLPAACLCHRIHSRNLTSSRRAVVYTSGDHILSDRKLKVEGHATCTRLPTIAPLPLPFCQRPVLRQDLPRHVHAMLKAIYVTGLFTCSDIFNDLQQKDIFSACECRITIFFASLKIDRMAEC